MLFVNRDRRSRLRVEFIEESWRSNACGLRCKTTCKLRSNDDDVDVEDCVTNISPNHIQFSCRRNLKSRSSLTMDRLSDGIMNKCVEKVVTR